MSSTSSSCSRNTSAAARSSKKARKRAELVALDRDAGRHRMAAALDDQPLRGRLAHQPAEIEAGDRAAGAGADAVRVEGDGEGRAARMFLQPRGEQADDAGMPVLAGGHDDRRTSAAGKLGIGLGARLGQHALLHRLPLLVQPVERLGDLSGLDRIVGREQPAAERGVADAPAGIDARADQEGEMEGVDRLADARDARQRREPGVASAGGPPAGP